MKLKTALITAGAVCTALAGIWSAVALALPLLQSEAPPFLGRQGDTIKQIAQNYQQMQEQFRQFQQQQSVNTQLQFSLALQVYQGQYNSAQAAINEAARHGQRDLRPR